MSSPERMEGEVPAPGSGPQWGGHRQALRLAAVLWLLVLLSAVGLFVGWHGAPGGDLYGSAAPAGVSVEAGPDRYGAVVRGGGTAAGLLVDVDEPAVSVVLGGSEIRVL